MELLYVLILNNTLSLSLSMHRNYKDLYYNIRRRKQSKQMKPHFHNKFYTDFALFQFFIIKVVNLDLNLKQINLATLFLNVCQIVLGFPMECSTK